MILGIGSNDEVRYIQHIDNSVSWFMTICTYGGRAVICKKCNYGKHKFYKTSIKEINNLDLYSAICANCNTNILGN